MMECDTCANYTYDDDYVRFITGKWEACPYYRNGDEYRVVRKQM